MKILLVINSLVTGGAEKLVIDTLPRYESAGLDIDLLLLNGSVTPFYKKLAKNFDGKILSLGFRSVYNPMNVIKIRRYINRYDIIHVHLFPSLYWVVLAKLLTGSKTKLVYTEHSISNRRFRSSRTRVIDKFVYGFYNKIIGITQSICDFVGNRFDKADDTVLIENGVDIKHIQEEIPLSKDALGEICNVDISGKKVLLQVSSFHPPKDQLTLIKSLLLLDSNVVLLLVGTGHFKKEVELKTKELGLDNRVFFLGVRTDVPALLKSVDIVVLSSRYEGMSLSSIEGMASGKPFIASDVPGLSEIVRDAGVLFPFGESEALAESISQLLEDPAYYDQIAQSCQTRASQYDISNMIDQHIRLYSELTQTSFVSRHD